MEILFNDFENFPIIKKIQDRCIGLVIGQNLPITKRLFLDFYLGGSYNFETIFLQGLQINDERTIKKTNRQVRVGLNLGYLF